MLYTTFNGSLSHNPHKWRTEVARLGAEDLYIREGPGGGRSISPHGRISEWPHSTLAVDRRPAGTVEQMGKR